MRLTCPNCKAQYEVDDSVIPEGGRDVQCSACAHTWYQYPASVALEMRASDLDDDDVEDDDAAAPGAASSDRAPRIDKSVLDVLREEAEREVRERRRTGGALETQGDLGLVNRPQRRAPSPERDAQRSPRTAATDTEAAGDEAGAGSRAGSRRGLLPDIEELSSTLEGGSEPRRTAMDAGFEAGGAEERRGFGAGFTVVALVAILMAAVYLFAAPISRAVPMLAEPLAGYLVLVDTARAWVAEAVRGLLVRVSGGA